MRKFFYRLGVIPIDLKKSGLMVVVVVVLLDMLEKNKGHLKLWSTKSLVIWKTN